MAKINWTRESQIWLQDIYDYIAANDPQAAARTIGNIYKKAQLLKRYPRLGHRYEPEPAREVRILLYDHYRITYLVKESGDIDILGVFHGALDIERYFI